MLEVARSLAATSTHHKAQIGAVIAVGKEILSVGVNGRKSHPLQQKYNRARKYNHSRHLLHAELDAIIKGKAHTTRFDNASMYVYRVMKSGMQSGMCRPCVGCMEALRDFGIKRVIYTTPDGIADEMIVGC
jgi:deoxycytidylate deaminase